MSKLTDDQIEIASKWWADQLREPKWRSHGPAYQFPETEVKAFESALEGQLRLKREDLQIVFFGLTVDYHPCLLLANALEEAGITSSRAFLENALPQKTAMVFRDGGVQVDIGNRKWQELLLTVSQEASK